VAQRVGWGQLSDSARSAFEWAVAVEAPNDLGTRGLLIGLIRSEVNSEPDQLLRHLGVDQVELNETLQTVRPEAEINPEAKTPVSGLDDFPSLTANAEAVLGQAAELWSRAAEGGPLQGRHLFGGILSNPESRAYQALDRVLKARRFDVSSLARTYEEYVLDPKRPPYADFLRERFPITPPPAPTETSTSDQKRSVGRIYVNYRREDASNIPLRQLLNELRGRFGGDAVIVDDVDPDGGDPREQIRRFLADSSALIVAIGPEWLGTDTHSRRRLTMPEDQLRVEIETAIAEEVPIVPVLFGGATMPAASELPESVAALASAAPVDFDASDFERAFAVLAGRLESVGHAPRPTRRLSIGTVDGASSDAVADEDQLGFAHYVDAFADLVTSPYTQPPLTIGIFGSWGMGKSFLLTHIEREILERQKDKSAEQLVGPQVHVVAFDAWEANSTEKVWPTLVRNVLRVLDKEVPWSWHNKAWTRLKYNVPREVRRLWAPLLAALLTFTALVITAVVTGNKGFLAALTTVVGALGVAGLIKAANDPIAHWVTTLFADSDYGRQIGYMEDIKHDLDMLEARLHRGGDAEEGEVTHRILVLIDNLDRCEPEKAVDVLQAVNLLLSFKSFIVCLGIDARIITGAVEKHYEGLLGKAGASGYEYLDKIVQIPFRIPEPGESDIKTFLSRQLGDPQPPPETTSTRAEQSTSETASVAAPGGNGTEANEPNAEAPLTPGGEAVSSQPAIQPEAAVPFTVEELEAFKALAKFLRPNPRHLKRLVNVYRLVRALARAQNETLILERPGATIRWLVLWAQWPYTANAMLEQFEQMLDQWGSELQTHVPRTDPLLQLYGAATKDLDRAARDSIDDPENELKGLLAATDFGLTWDELPRIRKYTVNFNPAVEERLQTAKSMSDSEHSDAETAEAEPAPAA